MQVDIIKYLKRNLQPDPDIDLTDEVLEYVAELERKAKSLDKIRAAQNKYDSSDKGKKTKKEYYQKHREERIEQTKKWNKEHPEYNKKYKERQAEYNRRWRQKHPDYYKNYMKEYNKKLKILTKKD